MPAGGGGHWSKAGAADYQGRDTEIDQGLARLRSLEPLAQPVLLSEALETRGRQLYAIALKPPS